VGTIVSNFFISMDGVVEAPDQWHFPYFDDAMGRIVGEGMQDQKGMMMGRRLYDEWSEYWPAQGPDVPFSSYINEVPKYVLTHRALNEPVWSGTTALTGDDVAGQVRALKQRSEGSIGMSGCATTVRWLISQGLLDELALLVHPIAVAKGQRLFEDTGTVPLELLSSETLPSGVMFVRYRPA
jgi:dihydrofolate reductase